MKNKIRYAKLMYVLLIAVILGMAPSYSVSAGAGDYWRIVDYADLLSDSEEEELSDRLDEISGRQQLDVVIVTLESLEGASAQAYADDFYDYNEYGFGDGYDGILFLISMEEREWYISTRGYGITVFTDAGIDKMSEEFLPYISDGDYAKGFALFADLCDNYITQANTGTPYDVDSLPKAEFSVPGTLAISLGIGFVVSLIVTGIMRMGLKSVRSQTRADSYVTGEGLSLTRERDLFLYRHVARREKPKESRSSSGGSSTHTSSSGARHGGRGGKF